MAEYQLEPKSDRKAWVIIIILIIVIGVLLYIFFQPIKKAVTKNETIEVISTKSIVLKAIDNLGEETDADYNLILNNSILAKGTFKPGVVEVYDNLIVNSTGMDCGDDIPNRLDNKTHICLHEVKIEDICIANNLFYDKVTFQCYVKSKNISLCPNETTGRDRRCYFSNDDLCDGQVSADICFNMTEPKSRNFLYLEVASDDYYQDLVECEWQDESCIVNVGRKPELNISISNTTLIIENKNDGVLKDITLCVGWTDGIKLFNIPYLNRTSIPDQYTIFYDKCYVLDTNYLVYSAAMSQDAPAQISLLLLGDFKGGVKEVRTEQNI